ncbi:MAG: MerR family transcriptional regulator [Maricaulaceae bacterium]|jgi:DNA-binding transcriptional MerR regulator
MFKIGEFAQIGRVSGRLLRHYDSLGLLTPEHTDAQTGYRYYSARQLPRLNRILALKALGFSLEQIGAVLDGEPSPEELRGMLAVRKAQVEQSLAEEQTRLRQIESRILQIEEQGAIADYDVVVRNVPSQPYASLRKHCADLGEAVELLRIVATEAPRRIKAARRDALTVVAHSDFEDETLDLEIGFTLHEHANEPIALPGDLALAPRQLEAVDAMATIVRAGPNYQSHLAYGALGVWMEANGRQIDGPCREVFLEPPFNPPNSDEVVMEIQFPVREAD